MNYKKWVWFGLAVLLIGLDQGSKAWILHELHLYQSVFVFPGFNVTLAFNSGSAFGFLSHSGGWHQWFFTAFSLVMSAILSIWIWYTPSKAMMQLLALSLILSGALGNVVDRLRFGYVIDFIDVYYKNHHWPIFNLADSAICIGAVILFFSSTQLTNNDRKP